MKKFALLIALGLLVFGLQACGGGGGGSNQDTTPNPFSFEAQNNVEPNTQITSNTITVSGISAASPISTTAGTLIIDGAPSAADTVTNDQSVAVRLTSSSDFSSAVSAKVTIGGVSSTFTVTTREADEPPKDDTTPNPFTFEPQTGVEPNAVVTSNAITVSGINALASIATTAGKLIIDGEASDAATVTNGQTVAVQLTASSEFDTSVSAEVTIGGVSSTFTVTTRKEDTTPPEDTTPAPFTFEDQTDVARDTEITSNAITIDGINAPAPISTSAGTLIIDGAVSSAATVTSGQTVAVRLTSSSEYSTKVEATVDIGGVSDTFSVTTVDAPPTITVTNTNDSGEGSLRQAVLDATDGTLINFADSVTGTIILLGQIFIGKDIAIEGPGADALTLSGDDTNRHFVIGSETVASISGMALTEGNITGSIDNDGGAIYIEEKAEFTLSSMVVSNNTASDVGGGILNLGTLTLNDTTMSDNTAGEAGGIWNSGVLELNNSDVLGNTTLGNSERDGLGGGIVNQGTLMLNGSTVNANTAAAGGGGIFNGEDAVLNLLESSEVKSNIGHVYGGGIYNYKGTVTIEESAVSGNTIPATGGLGGGGIYNYRGALSVEDSAISNNVLLTDENFYRYGSGGGIYHDSDVGLIIKSSEIKNNTASHLGGGIYNDGSLTVIDSAITGNAANGNGGGGIWNDDYTSYLIQTTTIANNATAGNGGGISSEDDGTIINSTITGNQADSDGGGIYSRYYDVVISYSTITDNTANGVGDGINAGNLTLRATIVAANGDSDIAGLNGEVTSLGYNLVGNGTDTGLVNGQNNDIVGSSASPVDPMLASLADNGGPTKTIAPLDGSPAIDHIPESACAVTTDQRGEPRPGSDDACDIGAFETQ